MDSRLYFKSKEFISTCRKYLFGVYQRYQCCCFLHYFICAWWYDLYFFLLGTKKSERSRKCNYWCFCRWINDIIGLMLLLHIIFSTRQPWAYALTVLQAEAPYELMFKDVWLFDYPYLLCRIKTLNLILSSYISLQGSQSN